MKKWSLLVFLCVLLMSGCVISYNRTTNPDPARPRVIIVNDTGDTIFNIRLSRNTVTDWDEDRLSGMLDDGDYASIDLPYSLDVVDRYNIRLETAGPDTYTKWDVLIVPGERIIFTQMDLDKFKR
jgi:hypothetical protein